MINGTRIHVPLSNHPVNDNNPAPLLNLYYVLDPMCSWCWAFRSSWLALLEELPDSVTVRYVLGGLAPDSDEPMPQAQRESIRQIWQSIAQRTGTEFNLDFWTRNTPRRSTYPACRAVIAAASSLVGAIITTPPQIEERYNQNMQNSCR